MQGMQAMTNDAQAASVETVRKRRAVWIDVGGTFTDALLREADGELRTCKVLSTGVVKGRVRGVGSGNRIDTDLRDVASDFFDDYELRCFDAGAGESFRTRVRCAEGRAREEGLRLETAERPPAWVVQGTPFELSCGESAPILAIRRLLGLRRSDPIGELEVRLGTTRGTNALLERKGARTAWITTEGFGDILKIGNQDRPRLFDLNIRKPAPLFEAVVEVGERMDPAGEATVEPDEAAIREHLGGLREAGVEALAVGFLHACRNGAHERRVREIAEGMGFGQISLSSEVSPTIKIVARGDTTVVDAYLTPVIRAYFEEIATALPGSRLSVMTNAGALAAPGTVGGKDVVLSGPAGGVVGFAGAARSAGFQRAIGFDMGGTSTDVSRFDGAYDYEYETMKAGVRISAPMLAIETVAAGGGSICGYDGTKLTVGPDSAGADPGPACYGRGGPLAVTDLNLFLGRVQADFFPFALDRGAVEQRLDELIARLGESGGEKLNRAGLARGLLRIANARMAGAIKKISVARGYDVREYALVGFGGAAGQHVCAVARELGMHTVLIHGLASVLSAYGMGLAEAGKFAVRTVTAPCSAETWAELEGLYAGMEADLRQHLLNDGVEAEALTAPERTLEVRYVGQSSTLEVAFDEPDAVRAAFEESHRRLYGHFFPGRKLEVVHARARLGARGAKPRQAATAESEYTPSPSLYRRVIFEGEAVETPAHWISDFSPGARIKGPALLLEENSCVVVEPGWEAKFTGRGDLILTDAGVEASMAGPAPEATPVELELFNHRFAAIAEQMGATLQRTALSVNVKERLDFSCALFTGEGDLVANAPHVPVHLGAMSECVKRVIEDVPDLAPGDVILTNDPMRGGSHLPDLTVITPVFDASGTRRLFFTASRAHHAEIGGTRPGSMPPDSKNLAEEGVLIRNFKVVEGGEPRLDALREHLTAGPYPSRMPEENLADVSAQIAANQRGVADVQSLMKSAGQKATLAFMRHIQAAAEEKMRACLRRFGDGVYRFEDAMDDGSAIRVEITLRDGAAKLDFTGSAGVHAGNLNANRAIVSAAAIYCFRCLIGEDIPLNSGVLAPVEIVLPEGMLNPPAKGDPAQCPAVAGGNVETSQRVVDVILGALGVVAASQGTMNNLTFGDARFGYYETLCGGSGAGPDFDGADAVHTHMTNTRLTDPEVLETQYPVQLRRFEIRGGSGGKGRHRGGNGVRREIEFLAPVEVSLLTQRRERAPFGLCGGEEGARGRNRIKRAGGEAYEDLGPIARLEAARGDRLLIETPGGGGYGSPEAAG
jgi:5-oxoprolinase (ATP-hydrolysing)